MMKKVLLVLVWITGVCFGADLYVPSQYSTIQAGINAANNGDTVWVANGTYTGASNKNLTWSGKHITVKSENGASNCIIDCENSGRGFYFDNAGTGDVIDGFTIRKGFVTGVVPANCGGGICCYNNSSPSITNCTISGNSASWYGGGIACWSNSSPSITNCTISGNTVTYCGGGIFCYANSSPSILNCTISENTASNCGGGIFCCYSSPSITNCTISENTATNYAGGIFCDSSSPSITNCTISGNSASYGGGICCYYNSSPSITNCTISGNTAISGGGIACWDSSSPSITNCIVSYSTNGYGIHCQNNSFPKITWCDFFSNNPGNYSGISDQTGINGNISADPQFISPSDFHLQPISPCIDSGSNTAPAIPAKDKDGKTRIIDGNGDGIAIVDMGAYEFGAYVQISKEILYGTPSGYTGGEQYVPGGTLTYIITYRNIGNGTATNTSIQDRISNYTYYATGTLRMGTIASTYESAETRTDGQDGDSAEFINEVAIFRIGTVGIGKGGRCYFSVRIK